MDDLLDPKDSELKKAKHIGEDDDESFPDNDFDDDFLGDKTLKKKPLTEGDEGEEDSLDKLKDDELDELDEPYDDVDEW